MKKLIIFLLLYSGYANAQITNINVRIDSTKIKTAYQFTLDSLALVAQMGASSQWRDTTYGIYYPTSSGGVAIGDPIIAFPAAKLQLEGVNQVLLGLSAGNTQWGILTGNESVRNLYIGYAGNLANYFWRANWNDAGVAGNTFQAANNAANAITIMELKEQINGSTGDYLHATSYGATQGNILKLNNSGQLSIGTASPNSSAKFHISSTTQGALLPVMTNTQIGSISTPASGLLAINSDSSYRLFHYNGSSWKGYIDWGNTMTSTTGGLVPTPANDSMKYLRSDGVFAYAPRNYYQEAMQILGGTILAEPLSGGIPNITANNALVDGEAKYIMVYLPEDATITGVKWWHSVQGNYTGDNYNGLALYSLNPSTGVCTYIDQTANDATIWSSAGTTLRTRAFGATHALTRGVYVVGFMYNNSAQVTAPTVGSTPNFTNSTVTGADLPNSMKYTGLLAGQTALNTTTFNMSALSNSQVYNYAGLY